MMHTDKDYLREKTIFWTAAVVSVVSFLLLAETHLFSPSAADQPFFGSFIYIGICWMLYFVMKLITTYSSYSKVLYPPILLIIFMLLPVINPFASQELWVYLLVFPVTLALGVPLKLYMWWSIAFASFYIFYVTNRPLIEIFTTINEGETPGMNYYILLVISFILGFLIVSQMGIAEARFKKEVVYEKNAYVVSLFQSLIPIVEARTQIDKKEIDDMSMLMNKAANYFDEPLLHKWEIELISMAHYVSRIQLPDYLYEKKGRLSSYEQVVVQKHCKFAADLIPEDDNVRRVKETIQQHHERCDGSGYPHGLEGDSIRLSAQLLGLTESYLSLTEDRIYRDAFSPEEAVEKLAEETKGAFSPDLQQAFFRCLEDEAYISRT
ncbi:HD-GYP domain-containing protein [Alkalicoccus halolimnae]|uniref:HD domain-containing phosphohydrolase n=1 Tax=Alkalicoccus halolimnae TaxID=1667239 RepID=A0AAJ8LWW1_9BACI|nr:HD domain-containing phosphohydrolase [Alkalicoccus halolimnae]